MAINEEGGSRRRELQVGAGCRQPDKSVAQSDKPDFAFGWWQSSAIDGHPRGQRGPVAQWLELAAHNRLVAGSIPAGPTILLCSRRLRLAQPAAARENKWRQ